MKLFIAVATLAGFLCCLGIVVVTDDVLAQEVEAKTFESNTKCKFCHNKEEEGAQYTVWTNMKHAQAFEVLSSDQAAEVAKTLGLERPPAESPQCLKCHVTGYDTETQSAPEGLKMEDGVQCDSCHGPSSAHLADGKVLRMKKDADIDISANIVRPAVEICVKCHNDENPTWDPEKYTLPDGETAGFDFDQAYAKIQHVNPKKAGN